MELAYEAFDKAGRAVSNVIDATDPTVASELLRRQGLFVTQIAPSQDSSPSRPQNERVRFGRGRRLKNLAVFTRQLYVLLSTGTPLAQAVAALARQTKDATWRQVIVSLRSQVEQGVSLSEAMKTHPQYFDDVYRSVIAAGESVGNLAPLLDRLAALVRKQLHLRRSIVGALTYPFLLLGVSTVVLSLLLTVVVPRFAMLFESMNVPLPPTTVALMTLSDLLRAFWWVLPVALVTTVVGAKWWLTTQAGRLAVDTVMVRLPGIGGIVRSLATARIARMLGILIDSNVPLLDALGLVKQAAGNLLYVNLIAKAQDAVTRGEPINAAFDDPGLIDPAVYEAIRNGEQSGKIGTLLLIVSDFLDEDNDIIIRSLMSIFEPVILVILGVIVGFVALSMFTPLFDLTAMTSGGGT